MASLVQLVAKRALREGDNGEAVKALQNALRRAGHELVVDGDFGPATRAAVERFQAASRIAADGYVGPVTAAFLDAVKPVEGAVDKPLPSVLSVAPWLTQMRAWTGTKEIPGTRSNPLILSWVKALGAKYPTMRRNIDWYTNDDIAWCGLGAAAAVGLCLPGYMPPVAPLWALNWGPWGVKLDQPATGALLPMRRAGGGHITIIESFDGTFFYCRGANQDNQINLAKYPKSRVTEFGCRWPVGAALPTEPVARRRFANAVSGVTEA